MTESEVVLTFNPSCHITIDSLPRSDLIMVGAGSQSLYMLLLPISPPAADIIWIPDCVKTLMNYVFTWNEIYYNQISKLAMHISL